MMDVDLLSRTTVDLGDGSRRSLLYVVEAWAAHVLKLFEEHRVSSIGEAWGVHDFIAALYLRDQLEAALRGIPGIDREPALVRVTDHLLMSFTAEDSGRRLNRVRPTVPSDPWWWRRLPTSGPVALELDQIAH